MRDKKTLADEIDCYVSDRLEDMRTHIADEPSNPRQMLEEMREKIMNAHLTRPVPLVNHRGQVVGFINVSDS